MYKYGKSCIKKLLCFLAICIAILAISFGVMWGLSTDYKIYGVPVLNYHQVNDEKHSALTLHVDQFREQMEYLHNQGYNTITLDQLYDYLENGSELPNKPIVITFDDGYVDNYNNALPILKEYNMKATLFKDEEVAKEILKTDNVAEIKALGRKVRNFDDKEWNKNKEEIITNGLYAKFSQNDDLKKKLLDTGKAVLVECAVNDKIWGIGLSMKDINRLNTKSWKGQNLLGKCLMTVREKLSNENK